MNTKALIQHVIEDRYSRHNVRSRIRKELEEDDVIQLRLLMVADSLKTWMEAKAPYPSKQVRKSFLLEDCQLSRKEIIDDIMLIIMQHKGRVPVQTVAGIVGPLLGYEDVFDGVKTAAEIIGVLAEQDLFDVVMANDTEEGTMMIECGYSLDEETMQYLANTKYLPPMIVPPQKVFHNHAEQYLTKKESLILGGSINHHSNKLSTDVINILNQQALSLDEEIAEMPEVPNKELDTVEKQHQFNEMCLASKEVYRELIEHGNEFYFTHKFDKRGRVYSQGYHVQIQGTEYKKALINLAQPIEVTK